MPLPPLEHNRDHLRQVRRDGGPPHGHDAQARGVRQASLGCGRTRPRPRRVTCSASFTAGSSLPGGALPLYRGRSFTGRIASASPDAPEPEVRIHSPPALQQRVNKLSVPLNTAGC